MTSRLRKCAMTDDNVCTVRGLRVRVQRVGSEYLITPIDKGILEYGAGPSLADALRDFQESMEMRVALLEDAVKLYNADGDKAELATLRSVWWEGRND